MGAADPWASLPWVFHCVFLLARLVGWSVGEDADDIGAAADLSIGSLLGIIGPELTPDLLREAGEREHVSPGSLEVLGHFRELLREGVQDPVERGVDGVRVRMIAHFVDSGHRPADTDLQALMAVATWPAKAIEM